MLLRGQSASANELWYDYYVRFRRLRRYLLASTRGRSRNDYYTAGGNITGCRTAGDAGTMAFAASFWDRAALTSGCDGDHRQFPGSWPIILFRLLNVCVTSVATPCRCFTAWKQGPIVFSACGSLVVVALPIACRRR